MSTRTSTAETADSLSGELEPAAKQSNRKLENALKFFKNLDPAAPLRGNVKLHFAVDDVVKHSMSYGLEPAQITALVDIIVNPGHKLSQVIRSKFVKCLIPSSKVPQAAVIRVLSSISAKIFISPGPSNLHSLLLRWILLVFDHIDGYDQLHKFYNVVFCFINSQRLFPHACHLLFLLTTKADVRLFRVQKLLGLVESLGPESCVLGLLMIYKVYCPHLVPMRLDSNHKVFFKAHDATWRSTIATIISQREEAESLEARQRVNEIQGRRQKSRVQPPSKRQKLIVPEVHSAANEVEEEEDIESHGQSRLSEKIPYTQIESFTSFLEAIDRIEHPSQVAACLTDTRLQLLLACDPDPLIMTRLCFWIQHVFAFGFKGTDKLSSERNERLLQMLCTFSKNVQGLPVVLGFLENFLPTWDGQTYAPLIFSLITNVRICSYDELYHSILEPLQRIFFSSDVYIKTMCISALTKLLWNFVLEGKSNIASEDRTSTEDQPQSSLQSERQGVDDAQRSSQQLRDVSRDHGTACDKKTLDTVYRLIKFLDVVFVVGMRMEDDHYLLQTSCLDLVQLISEIYQKYDIPLVCLPMCLIHRLLLSDCPATLARLCDIINLFREAFIALKSSAVKQPSVALTCSTSDDLSDKPENTGTEKFNALLLDVLGMLWQGRMFTDRKHKYESIFRFRLPSHLEGKLRDNALTIYTGPAFLGLAYKFLRETQREGKQVHPLQIEVYKETYLQFLDREGFPEFMQLVNTNIKHRRLRN